MLDEKSLLKLPVETRSGLRLGRVAGFEVDPASQMIVRYRVRPKGLSARILKAPLLVAREQVLEMTDEKMVVEDAVEKAMELAKAREMGLVTES